MLELHRPPRDIVSCAWVDGQAILLNRKTGHRTFLPLHPDRANGYGLFRDPDHFLCSGRDFSMVDHSQKGAVAVAWFDWVDMTWKEPVPFKFSEEYMWGGTAAGVGSGISVIAGGVSVSLGTVTANPVRDTVVLLDHDSGTWQLLPALSAAATRGYIGLHAFQPIPLSVAVGYGHTVFVASRVEAEPILQRLDKGSTEWVSVALPDARTTIVSLWVTERTVCMTTGDGTNTTDYCMVVDTNWHTASRVETGGQSSVVIVPEFSKEDCVLLSIEDSV